VHVLSPQFDRRNGHDKIKNMARKTGKIKRDQQVVVLEDINSKFSLILEQFSGVNKKIDNNHKDFLEFKGEMIEFRNQTGKNFKEVFGFMERTDKNLKIALEYLFRIDEEIQDMKTEIKDLKKLLKGRANLDKLMVFEKRLLKLEKLVFAKLA
jgi:hypothetical protein